MFIQNTNIYLSSLFCVFKAKLRNYWSMQMLKFNGQVFAIFKTQFGKGISMNSFEPCNYVLGSGYHILPLDILQLSLSVS